MKISKYFIDSTVTSYYFNTPNTVNRGDTYDRHIAEIKMVSILQILEQSSNISIYRVTLCHIFQNVCYFV